jgi:hypothetical protein
MDRDFRQLPPSPVPAAPQSFRLTIAESAAIASVEGIVMTQDMFDVFERFDREALSDAQRRAEILRLYGSSAD